MKKITLFLTALLFSGSVLADGHSKGEVTPFGYVNVEYGAGSRYDNTTKVEGEDRIGAQQYNTGAIAKYENMTFFGAIGGTGLSNDNNADGAITITDAFIMLDNIKGSNFSLSMGLQPLLFGLKPNGFPGDHTLQASVEYGGGGGFNASQQAEGSIIGHYAINDSMKLSVGLFDEDENDNDVAANKGSSLIDNYFVSLRATNVANTGLYGFLGYENRYVGAVGTTNIDSSKPIIDVGVGYKMGMFDFSLEYISLDQDLVNSTQGSALTSDESYIVAELMVNWEDCGFYVDYGNAAEAETTTIRVGMTHKFHKHLMAQVEWSQDDLLVDTSDVESIDFRLKAHF